MLANVADRAAAGLGRPGQSDRRRERAKVAPPKLKWLRQSVQWEPRPLLVGRSGKSRSRNDWASESTGH